MSKVKDVLYDYEDEVIFSFDGKTYIGVIEIIDKFGVFSDNSEPYYDIFLKDSDILVKHVPQSTIRKADNV